MPLLMAGMFLLMFGAARQNSATVDETNYLGVGYTFWNGAPFRLLVDHPPLIAWLASAPVAGKDLQMSEQARGLWEGRLSCSWTRPWSGPILSIRDFVPPGCQPIRQVFVPPHDMLIEWQTTTTYPIHNWYLWPAAEGQLFGKLFVFGSGNDGERMMLAGRTVMIILTLLAGLVAGGWAWRLGGATAAVLAVTLWSFNIIALAYGSLILTDVGATLALPAAIWAFAEYMHQPTRTRAVALGLAVATAVLMKFSAVLLGPIFVVLTAFYYWRNKPSFKLSQLQTLCFAGLSGYGLILLMYWPNLTPPPPLAEPMAQVLQVPDWFQTVRGVLVPGDFFKGLALAVGHASGGHEAYLAGEWRETGWWYYFPVAYLLKTPLPLIGLTGIGLILVIRQRKSISFAQAVPWIAGGIYLLFAVLSSINIGVRHLLPMYVLLAVGTAQQLAQAGRRLQLTAWILCTWLAIEAVVAYPHYIPYFNQLTGGTANGYRYLLDSNYDWGQDAKRLKAFLTERGIEHIYLDYFGTQTEIEHLHIRNTRVNAEQAKQIKQGWLVVSASQLMRPEWKWLCESRPPTTRVANTLFVYRLPDASGIASSNGAR
ncbi:MAG: hypothetical protein PCFJNLEI_02906 [Verrucomicrobiae bacterium]|nr:hypothetical protein [Verrucomicrobiae bacterium]